MNYRLIGHMQKQFSSQLSIVVRLWCIDLTVGLAVDVDHISMISVVVDDVRAVVISITDTVT